MKIVRKELSPDELAPPYIRLNPDTGIVQVTPDGGATWVNSDGADPRNIVLYPPRGGSQVACDSAANAVAAIHAVIDRWIGLIDSLASIDGLTAAICTGVALWIALSFIFWALAVILAAALLAAGAAAINAAFTTSVYDKLTCILLANMDTGGVIAAAHITTIKAAIDSDIGGIAGEILKHIIDIVGAAGLTNAGRLGTLTGVCACEWTYRWNFGVNNGGWVASGLDGSGWGSSYTAGCCWENSSNAIAYHLPVGVHLISLVDATNGGTHVAYGVSNTVPVAFSARCDSGGACGAIDWTIPAGDWLFAFASQQIFTVTAQGTGVRPALTGGSFI